MSWLGSWAVGWSGMDLYFAIGLLVMPALMAVCLGREEYTTRRSKWKRDGACPCARCAVVAAASVASSACLGVCFGVVLAAFWLPLFICVAALGIIGAAWDAWKPEDHRG